MKKLITAPLCSGLVVPGLGQIVNGQLKKGLVILGLVFLLFIAGAVKLGFIVNALTRVSDLAHASQSDAFRTEDLFLVAGIAVAFLLLWVYAVVDAFWVAFRAERSDRGKRQ